MPSLAQLPGLADVPPSSVVAGSTFVTDFLLAKINNNIKFGIAGHELFYAEGQPGQFINPPISRIDGYVYTRPEIFYANIIRDSRYQGGSQSFQGEIRAFGSNGDEQGKLTDFELYFVQGAEAKQSVADGVFSIVMLAKRNWGVFTLAAVPAYTDLADTVYNQDQPVSQTILRQLLDNSKLAIVRTETFWMNGQPIAAISRTSNVVTLDTPVAHGLLAGDPFIIFFCSETAFNGIPFTVSTAPSSTRITFSQVGADVVASGGRVQKGYWKHNEAIPLPTSPIDGHLYTSSEVISLPSMIYSGKPDGTGPSAAGRIRRIQINVSAGSLAQSTVTYYDGTTQTVTNDGRIAIHLFCKRTLAAMAGGPFSTFVDLDDSNFFFGKVAGDTFLKNLINNAKFSILSREFFQASYVNGNTVALPTSPVDGYTYARNQLIYFYSLLDTGDAGVNDIASFSCNVNQDTGVVSALVNGAAAPAGHGVDVITVGLRFQPTGAGAGASTGSNAGPGSGLGDPRDPGARLSGYTGQRF